MERVKRNQSQTTNLESKDFLQPLPQDHQTLVQFCTFLLQVYKENRPWVKSHIRPSELERTDNKCASIEAFLQSQKNSIYKESIPKPAKLNPTPNTTRVKKSKEEKEFVVLEDSKPKMHGTDPLTRLLSIQLALVSKWKGIINHVTKPIQAAKMAPPTSVTTMFDCLTRLLPLHESIIERLKTLRAFGIQPGSDVGAVFQMMYPHLKAHLQYCEGLPMIQRQLEETIQATPVSKLSAKLMKNISTFQWPDIPVSEYQRIIEDLLQVKSPEHADYFELLHAFHKFHELEQQILLTREGSQTRPHRHTAQCDCIKEKNMDATSVWNDLVWPSIEVKDALWKEGRLLKRQGTVHECLTALKSSIRTLVLFHDLVVISTRTMEVLHAIPIEDFILTDSKPDSGFFEVRKQEAQHEPIILYTTREDKAKWIHAMTKAKEGLA